MVRVLVAVVVVLVVVGVVRTEKVNSSSSRNGAVALHPFLEFVVKCS